MFDHFHLKTSKKFDYYPLTKGRTWSLMHGSEPNVSSKSLSVSYTEIMLILVGTHASDNGGKVSSAAALTHIAKGCNNCNSRQQQYAAISATQPHSKTLLRLTACLNGQDLTASSLQASSIFLKTKALKILKSNYNNIPKHPAFEQPWHFQTCFKLTILFHTHSKHLHLS